MNQMVTPTPEIYVIGTASLDVLHFGGQTAHTAGGAGMYTALAAYRAGAQAGLFAPKPHPMPDELRPVAGRVAWTGPVIPPEALPRLEIAHHGQGRATLVGAAWGAESQLAPERMPPEVYRAAIVHIAALSSAGRQLAFWRALARGRAKQGGDRPLVSAGTYARLVYGDTPGVRRLFEQVDFFFMNENEANALFGSVNKAGTRPGAVLFITRGEAGALVVQGRRVTAVPVHPVLEVDPTGAGDTFCGATLAGLARGKSPVEAARRAVILAGQTVGGVGPAALLHDISF